jgi:hypothetical protein
MIDNQTKRIIEQLLYRWVTIGYRFVKNKDGTVSIKPFREKWPPYPGENDQTIHAYKQGWCL